MNNLRYAFLLVAFILFIIDTIRTGSLVSAGLASLTVYFGALNA